MRKVLSSVFTLLLTSSLYSNHVTNFVQETDRAEAMEHWADSVFQTLSTDEKIGQLFMPMVAVRNTPQQKQLLRKYVEEYKIGGILYSKGKTFDQAELTNYTQEHAKVPLFISLDGEWGLSMRLENTTRFPRNMMLGAISNDSLIYAYGEEVGRQCRELGIHINFAPVLDLNSNPENPVIGNRSFGEGLELVTRKSIEYGKGLESNGVMAVGKHFPGHGDTAEDSHFTLPKLAHDSLRMYDYELQPFREFVNAGLSGMLTAHLAVPALDDRQNRPSSLSPKIVSGVLKNELGFTGLIFTDGLAMKGVSSEPNHCVRALIAGNDILLGPVNLGAQVESVRKAVKQGELPMCLVEEKCKKVLRYKYLLGLTDKGLVNIDHLDERLNTRHADLLNRTLHAEAITLLKDDNHVLPIHRLEEKNIHVVNVGNVNVSNGNGGNVNGADSDKGAFESTLEKYGRHQFHAMNAKSAKSTQQEILNATRESNLLIVAISSDKPAEVEFVNNLCAGRKFILVFFQSPYKMSAFAKLIPESEAVLMAYENSDLTGEFAAQALYGGIETKGKLSVSVPDLFPVGTGIRREKSRLGYALPEQERINYDRLMKVEEIIQEGLDEEAFPGCQLLIARNGNIVWEKSYGYVDYTRSKRVENDDVYDLASVSKASGTVAAVMKVRDDYKVKMTSKLSKYIPQLRETDKETLTFREALFHETGMRPGYPFYTLAVDTLHTQMPLFKSKRDETYCLMAAPNSFANKNIVFSPELVSDHQTETHTMHVAEGIFVNPVFRDSIINKTAALPLGKRGKYLYSCLNFVLLRTAVENITKQRLDKYLEKEVFGPLGATLTMYNPLEKLDIVDIVPTEHDLFLRKQVVRGYVHDEIAAYNGGVDGNAGLFSNAAGLAKLFQLFLNEGEYGGDRIYTKETARLFTMTKSPNSRRGMGFDKPNATNPNNSPTPPQVPASAYGHTGFTGTCFWVDPDNRLIYILLTNRVYPHRWNNKISEHSYRGRIQTAIYDALEK